MYIKSIFIRINELKSLLFANDEVVFPKIKQDMIEILNEVFETRMKMNINKTECMLIGEQRENAPLDPKTVKLCNTFQYLRAIITNDGKLTKDINNWIRIGRTATTALHPPNHKKSRECIVWTCRETL